MKALRTGISVIVLLFSVVYAQAALAADRHVDIINRTSYTMTHFQASNVDVDDWQEDILGDRVLRPMQVININIDDRSGHCFYDFRATFSNGQRKITNNVNVCSITSYTYYD